MELVHACGIDEMRSSHHEHVNMWSLLEYQIATEDAKVIYVTEPAYLHFRTFPHQLNLLGSILDTLLDTQPLTYTNSWSSSSSVSRGDNTCTQLRAYHLPTTTKQRRHEAPGPRCKERSGRNGPRMSPGSPCRMAPLSRIQMVVSSFLLLFCSHGEDDLRYACPPGMGDDP